MNLDDLIKKYDGKQVEVAGSSNAYYQCVDLVNAYIRDVLGLKIIEWTNAKDFPSRAGDSFDYIINTPEAVIKRGDIPVWGKPMGQYTQDGKVYYAGHIAICIEDGDINSFVSFDQNWSISQRCTIEAHSYDYVLGWLRAKGGSMSDDTMQISIKDFERIRSSSEKWDKVVSYLELPGDPAKTPYEDVMNKIKGYKARETELTGKIKELEAAVINREEQVGRLQNQLLEEQKLYSALSDNLKNTAKNHEKAMGLLEGRITDLQGQVDQTGKDKGKLNEQIKELEAKLGFTILVDIKALRMALVKF